MRQGDTLERDYCGIGRIIIPKKVSRDAYIKNCYTTGTVSIINRTHLDLIHEVDVDPEVLSRIEFPQTNELLGSSVVWVNIPMYNRPVIVGLLNQKSSPSHLDEGSINMVRDTKEGQVSIIGRASKGRITLNAISNTNSGGKLTVTVSNRDNTGELILNVSGSITLNGVTSLIRTTGNSKIESYSTTSKKKSFLEIQNSQIESRVEDSTSGYKVLTDSMEIGDASDKAVLGNVLKSFTEKLIDTIASSTVATSLGTMPLLNASQIIALKTETSNWISNYLKIQ